MLVFCTAAGQRSHQNPIGQRQRTYLQGLEKDIHNLNQLALEDSGDKVVCRRDVLAERLYNQKLNLGQIKQ